MVSPTAHKIPEVPQKSESQEEISTPGKSTSRVLKFFANNFNFRRELNNLRLQNVHTDVTIICGTRKLNAHKFVLASGSEYFYKILSNDSGKSPDVIEIFNAEPNILEELIFFIYTGELSHQKLTLTNVHALVKTANKLEIYAVNPAILKYLLGKLSEQNFSLALQLAGDLNDTAAECKVMKYITRHIEIILEMPEFVLLSERHICMLLNIFFRKRVSDDVILQVLLVWANYKSEDRGNALASFLSYVNFDKISPKFAQSLLKENKRDFNREAKIIRMELNNRSRAKRNFEHSLSFPNLHRTCDLKPTLSESYNLKSLEDSFPPESPSLIVIGKDTANRVLVVKYNLTNNTWGEVSDTKASLEERPGIGYHDYKVYFVGGEDYRGVKLGKTRYYDMKTRKLCSMPSINIVRSEPAVFVQNDILFVIGGEGRFGGDGLTVVERFDLLHRTAWSSGQSMRKRRQATRLVTHQQKLFATGGGPSECEYYNWEDKVWVLCKPLPNETNPETAFHVVADNNLYAFKECRPDFVYLFNCDFGDWRRLNVCGTPPDWVVSAVGWNSAIFALSRSKMMFVLNTMTNHWSIFSKLPNKLRPVFVAVEDENEKNVKL